MEIREATYQDRDKMGDLLALAAGGKTSAEICLSRATACCQRGQRKRSGHRATCLVALDGRYIVGWLYAEFVNDHELYRQMGAYEVIYLVGRNCGMDLLKELRQRTQKRIRIKCWREFAQPASWLRFLEELEPSVVGMMCEF